jgi:2',3'-cyclic-nucleotide 2'-phosphodiesterase (5'-nucleotidase family)
MEVDASFQNSGGIRADLNQGDITIREIYEITPFNNGTVIYTMTVSEIKNFLTNGSGFYYSGIIVEQDGNRINIKDDSGQMLNDNETLTVGLNDYIPAVYENLFPEDGERQQLTDAATIITWLDHNSEPVNYPECNRYFRYQSVY